MALKTLRFVIVCSLLMGKKLSLSLSIASIVEQQMTEYSKYCNDQDTKQKKNAATVADSNERVNNKCMCGFVKTPHIVESSFSILRTDSSNGAPLAPCVGGFAGPFPCSNVDLLAYMSVPQVNGGENGTLNDVWGWEDPQTGREYALVGTVSGTSFVDITHPHDPKILGKLPTNMNQTSYWRDIKTYNDHAFIVAESPTHGMQVFDLTKLRGLHTSTDLPIAFEADVIYNDFGSCHNLAINEETGFAYAVGTDTCSGGLHMIDIMDPQSPQFAGCFGDDGYTHDVHCVTYNGSAAIYVGREICFASNTDSVTIVDVSEKANPVMVSRTTYTGSSETYTHQGFATDDHNYFVFGDEADEEKLGVPTTTLVLNVMDLDSPFMAGSHVASTRATDHNQYIKGNLIYQANYRAGLRIFNMTDISQGSLEELGYFDIVPEDDDVMFNGAWSTYPYFNSGTVIVSGIEQGLFILRPTGILDARTQTPTPAPSTTPTLSPTSLSAAPTNIPTLSQTSPPTNSQFSQPIITDTPSTSPTATTQRPSTGTSSAFGPIGCPLFTDYPYVCGFVSRCQWDSDSGTCGPKPFGN